MRKRFPDAAAAAAFVVLSILVGGVFAAEPFRGNTRSRVFHQSSCRHYACPNCTAKFATVREAKENGYRACGICEPDGPARRSSDSSAAFVGNVKTHKFHRQSCRHAGCPNCTAKFDSREEAIQAGYAPGGCCDP